MHLVADTRLHASLEQLTRTLADQHRNMFGLVKRVLAAVAWNVIEPLPVFVVDPIPTSEDEALARGALEE